jgi:hypothetical protein
VPTVAACLRTVFRTYCQRGLQVSTCNADPEFEPLQNMFDGTSFNLCAQDEHVPEIEWYIRTVKDRVRSRYNSLLFKRIPQVILI